MRNVICAQGDRTRILHILSDSVPQTVRFTAHAVAPDGVAEGFVEGALEGALEGIVEVERSTFLRRRKAERLPLEPQNSLRKGMFDIRFAVFVTPAQNTRIVLESRHFSSRWLYLALGLVLAAGLVAGLGGVILGSI